MYRYAAPAVVLALVMWLGRALVVSLLVTPSPAQAALPPDQECKDRGGQAECTKPELTSWTYGLCDELGVGSVDIVRDNCSYSWYGQGAGVYGPDSFDSRIQGFERCIAPSHQRTPICTLKDQLVQDWGATLNGSCGTGTRYNYGEVVQQFRQYIATGTYDQGIPGQSCSGSWSEYEDASQSRYVICPVGFASRYAPDGVHLECWRNVGLRCPFCADPVSLATGDLMETETDYQGRGPQPLRFVRTYFSAGFHRPLGQPDPPPPMIGGHWFSNYDRRVNTLAGSSTNAMATAVRPDGAVKYFDFSGNEIWTQDGTNEHLAQVSGGGWQYRTAGDEVETYDSTGKLLSITDRQGLTQTLTYSDASTPANIAPWAGLLIKVTDAFGHSLAFTYNAKGLLSTMTDPMGGVYSYTYNNVDGNNLYNDLASVTYPQVGAQAATKRYQAGNRLLNGIVDENGQQTTFVWSGQQNRYYNVASVTQPIGTYQFTLPTTATFTDPMNVTTSYGRYLQAGTLKVSTVAQACADCPPAQSTTYDANGFVASTSDYNGNVTTYTRDSRGLELSRTEASGTPLARTITTQWDATFHVPLQISEPGRRTTYTYDSSGRKLTETIADTTSGESRTTAWTYNALGLVATIKGPRTDVNDLTTFSYDASGNVAAITDAKNHVTQFTNYDASGNLLRSVDPNGVVTTMTYDARGRLTTRTVAPGTAAEAKTTFDYDLMGHLLKTTLPDASYIQYTYDAGYRLTDITDKLGNRIHYTLDARGSRTKEEVFDPSNVLKRTKSQVFNTLGRLTEVHGATGQVTVYGYDAQGNRTTETQQTPTGNFTTTTTYDALNRAKTVTDAANGVTTYGYDPLSQLASVTDPGNLTTTYFYNALGDLQKLVSPDTGTTKYTYDAGGNRVTETDARGIITTSAYDALNRLWWKKSPGQGTQAAFEYDGSNFSSTVPYSIGRLTYVQHEYGSNTQYRYDAHGNVISAVLTTPAWTVSSTESFPSGTFAAQYRYDAADRITGITYPSGSAVAYTRDAAGRVTSINTQAAGQTVAAASGITYLPFGPPVSMTLGNGLSWQGQRDQDYRITHIQAGSIQDSTYSYDLRDNVIAITDNLVAARSQSNLQYDALSRLTQAHGSYGSLVYKYGGVGDLHGVGDRLTQTGGSGTDTYSYDAASHHLMSVSGPDASTFSYDGAGNTVQKNAYSYSYVDDGRLQSVAQNGTNIDDFSYLANGQRLAKFLYGPAPSTAGDQVVVYNYDLQGHLIAEMQLDNRPIREYVWLGDQPIVMTGRRKPPATTPVDQTLNTSNAADSNTTALYHFDTENVTPPSLTVTTPDSGPNGLNGTLGGSVLPTLVLSPWAGFGNAFQFDGVNRGSNTGAINFGSSLVFSLSNLGPTDQRTIDFKFQLNAAVPISNNIGVLSRWRNPSNLDYFFGLYNTGTSTILSFTYFNAAGQFTGLASPALVVGTPYDVRVTLTPTGVTLFINGTPAAAGGPKSSSGIVTDLIAGGFGIGAPESVAPMTLDELRFSNAVRTDGVLPPAAPPQNPAAPQPEIFYFHTDHLGTPQKLTDSTGAIAWDASYDSFGNAKLNTELVVQPLRFPGQYFDAETGLNQNWNRDYDPSIGRYLQSDPLGLEGGISTYGYGAQNPLLYTDPEGLLLDQAQLGQLMAQGARRGAVTCGAVVAGAVLLVTPSELSACDVPEPTSEASCPSGDDEACRKALADARSLYRRLQEKRVPAYTYGLRHGPPEESPGHHQAILETQKALRDAINRVKRLCKNIPAEMQRWEEVATPDFPARH